MADGELTRPTQPDGTGAPPTASRAAIAFIFVTILLDMLAFGMLSPVLPLLILQFEGGDARAAAHANGLMGFVWAGMQFLSMPLLGALSDRFGRRPVILISCVGLAASFLNTALAPSIAWIYLSRILSGATAASFTTAFAYIADVTPPERRAKAFGQAGAAFGVGFVIGPAIGGLLGGIVTWHGTVLINGNPQLPFFVAAGLSLVNAAYGLFVLPESLAPERRAAFSFAKANPIGAMRLLGRRSDLTQLALVNAVQFLVHTIYPSLFSLYAASVFGWSASGAGVALMLVGLTSIIEGAVLVQPTIKLVGERNAILLGIASTVASLVVFGLAPNGIVMLSGLVVGLLGGVSGPAMTSIMTRTVGPTEQGALQGALGAVRGVTEMVGPLLFSTFLFSAGMAPAIGVPGLPWLVAAALMLVSMLLAGPAITAARFHESEATA